MKTTSPDVGQRIRLVREKLGLYPAEFAKKAGLSNSIIYNAESGRREAGLSVLARLSRTYGISLNWLVFGLGPMYLKDSQLPFRGDAMEILGKNYPITDAPDLVSLMQDQKLVQELELTAEEIHSLGELIKVLGRAARLYDREDWLKAVSNMRRVRLETIEEVRKMFKKQREK